MNNYQRRLEEINKPESEVNDVTYLIYGYDLKAILSFFKIIEQSVILFDENHESYLTNIIKQHIKVAEKALELLKNLFGDDGGYCFTHTEWEIRKKHIDSKTIGIEMSQEVLTMTKKTFSMIKEGRIGFIENRIDYLNEIIRDNRKISYHSIRALNKRFGHLL